VAQVYIRVYKLEQGTVVVVVLVRELDMELVEEPVPELVLDMEPVE